MFRWLMRTAVVIGSTGLTGLLVVKKLVQDGSFGQIIAICRNKNLAEDMVFSNPKVRLLQFDFQNWNNFELQISSFIGTSLANFFCCLGTTVSQAGSQKGFKKVDYEYVVNFAKLAKSCHAEQLIVISALGADKNSVVYYNRIKGEMENDVQLEYSGKLYFLRPSLLLGDRKEFRFGERLAILFAPIYSLLFFGTFKKYLPVPAVKVAEVMVLLAAKKIIFSEMCLENQDILKI